MPIASSCPDASLLPGLLRGQLSAEEVEHFAQHVEQCPRCAALVESLPIDDTLADALKAKSTKLDRPEDEVVAKLAARLKHLRRVVEAPEATAAFASIAAPLAPLGEGTQEVYDFLAPPRGCSEIGWLGPYRILKVLGVGGMGVVFQAEDPALKRLVALKAMKPAIAADSGARKRFLREAQTAAAVKNDHVVTIYQVGEDRGVPYLAMEFLEGEPLDGWLKRGRQPNLAQLLRMGREMALGLTAAHERGLIHRDIKPGNIWLEMPKGRVKLLDFGLARATASDVQVTQSGAIVGTPAYMAPEQARGEKVDPRCDLFSLGCVLYRLATGAMPFKGSDTMSVLMSLAMDTPRSPREINVQLPPALGELIENLLAKDPANRPASAKAVVQALQAFERDLPSRDRQGAGDEQTNLERPVSSPPPNGRGSAKVGAGRRRGVLVAASLLILLSGLAAALMIRIKSRDGQVTEIKVPEGSTVEIATKEPEPPNPKVPILPSRLPDKEKPFVLLRGGKAVHEFRTFGGLRPDLQNGDVIEVHANGPLHLPRIALEGSSLTLQAAPGYRPRFETKDVSGGLPWIAVKNASLTLDGCDFRCPAGIPVAIQIEKGPAQIRNCCIFQPDSHNNRLLVYDGPRLLVADSLLVCGFSHGSIHLETKAEVELRNTLAWNNAYALFNLGGAGGQKMRFLNCTFAGGGNRVQLQLDKNPEAVELFASENVFHISPGSGTLLVCPFSEKELKKLVHWQGHNNCYNVERGNSFYHGGFTPSDFKLSDLAAWRKYWGEDERGGRYAEDSRYKIDAVWQAASVAAQLELLRAYLDKQRQRLPKVGPNLDLVGPGDAYVRALEAAGKPVSKEELRPEAEDGGPIVLLRKGKAIHGYAELASAVAAAVDGDIVELRTDREIEGITRDGQVGKSLVLRAGAGYRPVLKGGVFPGVGDSWVVEGIHFRGVLNSRDPKLGGRITRLANCSFEPDPARAWADLVQFNQTDEAAIREIVNCFIPGSIAVRGLAKGQRLRLVNSLLACVRYDCMEKGEHRLELENCLCWDPTCGSAPVAHELKDAKLAVHARNCIFETMKLLRTAADATTWNGDGNVYAIGNASWIGQTKEEKFDLNGWRKLWNSDADSIEVEPLRYDPRQWRLLSSSPAHKSAPGGKDYGAEVDKIATLTSKP